MAKPWLSSPAGTATRTIVISAHDAPPVAAFSCSASGLAIVCNGGPSHDPDGSIVAYAWDFGDHGRGSGVNALHVYSHPFDSCVVYSDEQHKCGEIKLHYTSEYGVRKDGGSSAA